MSSMPANFENFREKYEIIMNVWRFLQTKTQGRRVLAEFTDKTWDHRRWLMDSKAFQSRV